MHISHDVAYDVKAEYPVHLHIEKMSTHLATPEAAFIAKGDHGMHIRSRYLIGSDGAHSWVRKRLGLERLGLEMQGEATQDHWGVLDCVPITVFHKRALLSSPLHKANIAASGYTKALHHPLVGWKRHDHPSRATPCSFLCRAVQTARRGREVWSGRHTWQNC
jgi:2-polyprenyl-6-methoxyphenol hydroxylase-like FAD-dependent oxidoreductase